MRVIPLLLCLLWSVVVKAQFVNTKCISSNEGILSNYVKKTYIDRKGVLWIGTRAGLLTQEYKEYRFAPASLKHKFTNVFDILEDEEGGLWG